MGTLMNYRYVGRMVIKNIKIVLRNILGQALSICYISHMNVVTVYCIFDTNQDTI